MANTFTGFSNDEILASVGIRRQDVPAQVNITNKGGAVTPSPTPAVSTAKDEGEDKGNFWDRVKGMFGNIFTKEEDTERQPTTLQTSNKAESKDDEDATNYLADINRRADTAVERNANAEQARTNLGYVGERGAAAIPKAVQDLINMAGYTGQAYMNVQNAAQGNDMIALGAVTGNDALMSIGEQKVREATEPELKLDTVARFGDKANAKVEEKYAGRISENAAIAGDIASTVGYMVPSIISNIIAPGSSLFSMALSAGGGATQEAIDAGVDHNRALLKGAAVGVTTALSEKIADGLAGIFGKGAADDFIESLVKSKLSSEGAQSAVMGLYRLLGEGFEEFAEELANKIYNELIIDAGTSYNYDERSFGETLKDAGISGLMGMAVSGIINTANGAARGLFDGATPKQIADAAADTVISEVKSNAAQGEISPSDGVSAEPTTYTAESENVGRVDPAVPGFEAVAADGEQRGTGTKDDGLGAANAGFTINEGAQVPTQNKTVTQSLYMTDAEKQMLAPETHERISEAESINRAQQNFYTDSDGNIVNLDLTVEDLLNKDVWTAVEQDTAQIAIMELTRRARESGDYSKVQELGRKIETIGGTEVARSLQARQKWVGESGANIMIAATKEVEALPEAERNEVLNEVAQLAGAFDEVLKGEVKPKRKKNDKQEMDYVDEVDTKLDAKREVEGLMELIRRTAKIRRTTGLFSKEMSRFQEWALKHVADRGDIEFLRSLAANGILSIASDKQSKTAGEWITTYRRQAMLSKAATIMRNLVSNGVFDIVDTLARDIVVPLDAALSKRTGTRSVAVDKYYFSKAKRQGTIDGLAKSFLEVGLDVDASGNLGRYESTSNRTAKMSGGVVSRLFSTWEKYGGYGLVTTDAAAKGGTEAEIQRGIDELYNKGLIKDDSLENAGESEAEYRTFQDKSRLSEAVLDIRRDLDKPKWRIGGEKGVGIGTLAIPFAKTPTNLATRAVEYSPAGLIKGGIELGNILIKGQKGNFTAAEQARVVQEFGRGFTGSALIGLSVWGALSGVIKTIGNGSDDEDKDKTAYDKMSGQNGTQWNLSAFVRGLSGGSTEWQNDDVLMNISFLEPINSHLTAGALIAEDIRNEEASFVNLAWDSVEGAMKSILDMPMMSAIKDAMQQFEYAEGDNNSERAGNALLAYGANQISSFVPNALKGIAQGIDPIQRNTYAGDNLWEQTLSNVMSGIPGLRSKVEAKTDSFGNEMRNEGGVLNFLNSNILPGYITHYNEQTGSALLDSVYELTGNASIYPDRKAPNSISGTDAKGNEFKFSLDSEAGQKYLATAGAEHEAFLKAAENNAEFSKLSTEEQAAVLKALRSQAHAEAKHEAIADSGYEMELSEADKLKASLPAGALVDYLIAKEKAVIPNNYTSTPTWQKFEIAAAMPESFALDMIIAQGGDTGRRIAAAVDSGVDLDKAIAYYRATTERNNKGENPSTAEENQRIAALGLTAEERGALIRAFDMKFD